MKNTINKGISILELIMVFAIVGLLVALIIPNLSNFKKEQTLKNTTEEIVSLLNKAKIDSNSFLDGSVYSVYFTNDKVVYFKGTSYSVSDPKNITIFLNSSIEIPVVGGVNLTNSINQNTITFPQLTEDVSGYGTIILRMTSDNTRQKVITINKLGSISQN